MSINYHAYQNKGYLLSVYELVWTQWTDKFTGFDPVRAGNILNLKHDQDYVHVTYYNRPYRLCLHNGQLERYTGNALTGQSNQKTDRPIPASASSFYSLNSLDLMLAQAKNQGPEPGWTRDIYFNEAMAIYHYLEDVKDNPGHSGVWIPNYSLDPRAVRKEDILGKDFAGHFAGKDKEFTACCKALGGRQVATKADIAYEFDAFPQIPVQIHFYDEDDDFPAQVQMLVDSQVTDYVHLECTGCIFSDLFEQLIQLQKNM